ncbi:putative integral membrane protein [Leishmania donovani]|uniref:Putative integral membrane protein n=1 Tax=Leishmania donovani TaxID=5661 RepID=A0A504XPE2_LEIDO|nr:putative integral membrane protein [Leishmania donovani]
MPLASSCVSLCAPFTAVAAVLLFMMSHMLRCGNWTFEVLAAKNGWDRETKANTCLRGGLLYLFTSLALWIAVFLHAPARRLWMQLQWSRRREDDGTSREALLHGDDDSASHAGGRYGRRASKRLQSRTGSGRREEVTEIAAVGAPMARRFSYFQRSLTDVGGGGSDNSMRVSGDLGSAGATPSSGHTGAGTVSWMQSRGLRSRGTGSAASGCASIGAGGGLRLNSISFNVPSPTPTTGADSMDDMDFMSDVEVDGMRHYTTPQVRASAWGLHRPTTGMEAPGGAGLGGWHRAQARGAGNNGAPATERGDHGHSGSTEPSTTAARLSMLTSLWQTRSSGPSPTEAHRASSRRVSRGHGPPAALSGGNVGGGAKSKST